VLRLDDGPLVIARQDDVDAAVGGAPSPVSRTR
jgi:hypothetical protein